MPNINDYLPNKYQKQTKAINKSAEVKTPPKAPTAPKVSNDTKVASNINNPREKRGHRNVLMASILLLLVAATAAAFYLMRNNQDLRQQASGPTYNQEACMEPINCGSRRCYYDEENGKSYSIATCTEEHLGSSCIRVYETCSDHCSNGQCSTSYCQQPVNCGAKYCKDGNVVADCNERDGYASCIYQYESCEDGCYQGQCNVAEDNMMPCMQPYNCGAQYCKDGDLYKECKDTATSGGACIVKTTCENGCDTNQCVDNTPWCQNVVQGSCGEKTCEFNPNTNKWWVRSVCTERDGYYDCQYSHEVCSGFCDDGECVLNNDDDEYEEEKDKDADGCYDESGFEKTSQNCLKNVSNETKYVNSYNCPEMTWAEAGRGCPVSGDLDASPYTTETIAVSPGQSICLGNDYCGVRQIDGFYGGPLCFASGYNDCDPTSSPPTGTPTTPETLMCRKIEVLDDQRNVLSDWDDKNLTPESQIRLRCYSSANEKVDHFEFALLGPAGNTRFISQKEDELGFSVLFQPKNTGTFIAECRVCETADSCQNWINEDIQAASNGE